MYLIFKLSIVILILYLKLNGLNAIPLINHNKSSQSALTLVKRAAAIETSTTTTTNIKRNQNDTKTNTTYTYTTNTYTITNTTTTTINPLILSKNALSTTTTNDKRQLITIEEYALIDDSNRNQNRNESKNSHSHTLNDSVKQRYNYQIYNKDDDDVVGYRKVISTNATVSSTTISYGEQFYTAERLSPRAPAGPETKNHHQNISQSIATTTATTKRTMPPFVNDLMTFSSLTTPTNGIVSIPERSNENNVNDEFGLGNILHNTFNSSDVNRFLLKYDSDDGNACFLDSIKKNLMWWSNQNGTLHEEAIFNITNRQSYLDLSFRNITKDDHLYKKTRSHTYLNGHDIIIFSAAQNNLTHAPYRTLSLLNGTLKYLTLKGNQFAAYTPEMQKDALSRIFNDASRHNTNNTEDNSEYTETTPIVNPDALNTSNGRTEDDNTRSTRGRYKQYKNKVLGKNDEGIAWATFPPMPLLTELDISNCHIEFVTRDAFKNLTSLRRLFIAHNKMLTIPHDTFLHTASLQYLDLSFTNVLDSDYQIPLPTLEAIYNLIYGVKIQSTTFRHLPELVYLDLSHTKLTRNSAVAFTHLGDKLRYLSLCYTAFPMVGNALFKNTALVGLDLSGNPYAAYNIIEDAFEGVADTLKYLYFERSNIKDLAWLKYLSNLRVLGLSGNNINSLSLEVFSPLSSLQLLDLSSNHIGNWYNRVFTQNEQLRVLTLRDNNINIITSEMLRDFQLLDYLSLGDNNFVCDCLLRDLVDIAASNNKDAECSKNVLQEAQEILTDNAYLLGEYLSANVTSRAMFGYRSTKPAVSYQSQPDGVTIEFDITKLLMQRYVPTLKESYKNIKRINYRPKIRVVSEFYRAINQYSASTPCPESEPVLIHDKLNSSTLKFQLLDYEDDHYWCFNETERMHFMQLNCQTRAYVEDLTKQLHKLTKSVVGSVCAVVGVSLIGVLLYLKRWHIHYYFSYLKTAALVSVAAKDAADQLNSLAESDPNLVYDIFISYCQSDRQWVIEELLPNVEEAGDVSICMHERDFQIGLTILDNIVSCMDRSRALMLIISSNFLLSHWCQFEMHLAQHRIFEVSKEHLILVFLEDIPRSKRPKTLQYLMEVKTYIKWPNTGKNGERTPSSDERKFFWKRLKRSLENIGLNPYSNPRESHA